VSSQKFTWVIFSSENEASINVKYAGRDAIPPPPMN
jgi:hypothetical protein